MLLQLLKEEAEVLHGVEAHVVHRLLRVDVDPHLCIVGGDDGLQGGVDGEGGYDGSGEWGEVDEGVHLAYADLAEGPAPQQVRLRLAVGEVTGLQQEVPGVVWCARVYDPFRPGPDPVFLLWPGPGPDPKFAFLCNVALFFLHLLGLIHNYWGSNPVPDPARTRNKMGGPGSDLTGQRC